MTRVCAICDLHPFLERWAESLIESGLSLRQVAASMKAHGIDVSYQAVNRHKKHMPRPEKIKRLKKEFERLKRRSPPMHETLNRFKKQRTQIESWIKAEKGPPKEAFDVLRSLKQKIDQLSWAIQLRQRLKSHGDLLFP